MADATFSSPSRASGEIASVPEVKRAACIKLTTSPRGCMLITMRPDSISFFKSSLNTFSEGISSTSLSAFSSGFSGTAFCVPPGPRIIALPLPFSLTVPPRMAARTVDIFSPSSAFFTESDTCCALPLSVWEVANMTTKKANKRVTKSA